MFTHVLRLQPLNNKYEQSVDANVNEELTSTCRLHSSDGPSFHLICPCYFALKLDLAVLACLYL